jgi:hypothetical protein
MRKPPPKAPPHWVCHSAADIKRFEEWTNARLDEMFEPRPDEHLIQISLQDPKFATAVEHEASTRLKRGRVIMAARAGDTAALARLADTEELRRLAFRRHRRGREKGERRPRDLAELTRWCCEEALADMERIHQIWQRPPPYGYGRRNRAIDPTAISIAARRWGIEDVDTLINFKKNRHRNQRRS